MKTPMPFQKEAINIASKRKVNLLGDEMGLGKTIQGIGIANTIRAKKMLVICPANMKVKWYREFMDCLERPKKIQIIEKRKDVIDQTVDIIIVNYDLIIYPEILNQLRKMKFAIGLVDECHYLKTLTTKRTKAVLSTVKSKLGVIHNCVYKVFISGTPMVNRPIELYPILKSCSPQTIEPYVTYRDYAFKFCGAYEGQWGLDVRGASNLEELNTRLRSTIMIRRLKKDVMKELPPRRYEILELDPDPGITIDPVDDIEDLGQLATLRRQTALAKMKQTMQIIESDLEEVDKIVVFAYHREVVEQIYAKFNRDYFFCRYIYGGMSQKRKQEAMDTFQNNPDCRLFIGQINSVGVGVDLFAAHHIIFAESSWVPGEVKQCVDRCHRIGQDQPVMARFLVIRDSVEQQMMETVLRKVKIIRKAVN